VATTLANRPFRSYLFSQVLFNLGLLTIVTAMAFMVETLLARPKGLAGPLIGVALVSGIACVPLVLRVANAKGAKRALRLSMQWFAIWAAALALLGPLGHTAAGLPVTLLILAVIGFAIGGLYALPNAILADITAHDRRQTGLDRQGMFFCVRGLLLKLSYSAAPWLVDQMRTWIHNQATALCLIGPVAALLCLIGDRLFATFPEDEVRAAVEGQGGEPTT
jgi:GPH family glycoside/pentoside/hexuronide:cation symporter